MGDKENLNKMKLKDMNEKDGERLGGFEGWKMKKKYKMGVMKENINKRENEGILEI